MLIDNRKVLESTAGQLVEVLYFAAKHMILSVMTLLESQQLVHLLLIKSENFMEEKFHKSNPQLLLTHKYSIVQCIGFPFLKLAKLLARNVCVCL